MTISRIDGDRVTIGDVLSQQVAEIERLEKVIVDLVELGSYDPESRIREWFCGYMEEHRELIEKHREQT